MNKYKHSIILVSEIPSDMLGEGVPYTFFYLPTKEAKVLLQTEDIALIDLTDHSTHPESQYAYLSCDARKLINRLAILFGKYNVVIIVAQCFEFAEIQHLLHHNEQLRNITVYSYPLQVWNLAEDEEEGLEDQYDFYPIVPANIFMGNKTNSINDSYECRIYNMLDGIFNEKYPIYEKNLHAN